MNFKHNLVIWVGFMDTGNKITWCCFIFSSTSFILLSIWVFLLVQQPWLMKVHEPQKAAVGCFSLSSVFGVVTVLSGTRLLRLARSRSQPRIRTRTLNYGSIEAPYNNWLPEASPYTSPMLRRTSY